MAYFDLVSMGSFIGLFAGILLVLGGLYARRGGRLRHRHSAEVLAGFAAERGFAF